MRDFTTNDYCDFLWINDLLSLEKGPDNEFRASLKKTGKVKTVSIKNVIVLGTIVEMRDIGERGILYLIDDGTGVITCKYNCQAYNEVFDIIHEEGEQILNDSCTRSLNQSEINNTMSEDDTIFNDYSLQEEEAMAIQTNSVKALKSIWADIEDSFSGMMTSLNIGDTVIIHGRLYNYFHINQIHVNIIRKINIREEMLLKHIKFVDGYEALVETEHNNGDLTHHVCLVENSRRSGIMTFDHIQHLDVEEIPTSKIIISKENLDKGQTTSRKRKSLVTPHLQGSMTFDTFGNMNDSGPKPKLVKNNSL